MRPLITSALIAASLALAGNGAMAADTYAKTGAIAAPAHAAVHVAARQRYPVARYGFAPPPANVAQIIGSFLANPWLAPYVAQYGGRVPIMHSSRGTYEPYDPPTYDTSSPPDTSIQDSLNAQAAQQIQDSLNTQAEQQTNDSINESNEINATIAADAAQAAADDAAQTQQIMNNGGL
jgi:hypothetical protein